MCREDCILAVLELELPGRAAFRSDIKRGFDSSVGNYRQDQRFDECADKVDKVDLRLEFYEKLCVAAALILIFACIIGVYYMMSADVKAVSDVQLYYYSKEELSGLNNATAEELMEIEGIGTARATAIIKSRDSLGGFTNYGQLLEIDGISDKLAGAIMDYYDNPGVAEEKEALDMDDESTAHP